MHLGCLCPAGWLKPLTKAVRGQCGLSQDDANSAQRAAHCRSIAGAQPASCMSRSKQGLCYPEDTRRLELLPGHDCSLHASTTPDSFPSCSTGRAAGCLPAAEPAWTRKLAVRSDRSSTAARLAPPASMPWRAITRGTATRPAHWQVGQLGWQNVESYR